MTPGKWFEQKFEKSVTCFIQRLSVKNKKEMCDFLVFDSVMLYGCECKSYDSNTIPIHKDHIKDHQIDGLADMIKHKNCLGLFFLNFRKSEKIYVVSANYLRVLRDKKAKSISIKQAKANHITPVTMKWINSDFFK